MMHPGMFYWWKNRRDGACGEAAAGCGPGGPDWGGWAGRWGGGYAYQAAPGHHGDFGGGAFGVRRPLRFLAWKLDLDEHQVGELAKILDELKTERAQAEVDGRRTVSAFADAIAGDAFDQAKASEGGKLRVDSAERLRNAVTTALGRIHALLSPEQREKLAYLIRTGVVTL